MNKIFKGKLFGYFETGTEGVVWALEDEKLQGYEGLILLKAGDLLEIYSDNNELVNKGKIIPDTVVGETKRPSSTTVQPTAFGRWIHWTQEGFSPDDWASFFIDKKYYGILRRKKIRT